MTLMGEVISPVTVLTGIGQQIQASTGALAPHQRGAGRRPDRSSTTPTARRSPHRSPGDPPRRRGFSYTSERQTLDGVDATVTAGSRVAFVGPDRCGQVVGAAAASCASTTPTKAPSSSTGATSASRHRSPRCANQLGVVFQDTFLFDTTIRENIAHGTARRHRRGDRGRRARGRAARLHPRPCRAATTRSSASAAAVCRAGNGSASRSPVPCCAIRAVLAARRGDVGARPAHRAAHQRHARARRRRPHDDRGHAPPHLDHRLRPHLRARRRPARRAGHATTSSSHAAASTRAVGGADGRPSSAAEPPFDAAGALARHPAVRAPSTAGALEVVAAAAPDRRRWRAGAPAAGGRRATLHRAPGTGAGARPRPRRAAGPRPPSSRPGDAFGLAALLGQERGAVLEAYEARRLLVARRRGDRRARRAASERRRRARGRQAPSVAPAGGQRLSRLDRSRRGCRALPRRSSPVPSASARPPSKRCAASPALHAPSLTRDSGRRPTTRCCTRSSGGRRRAPPSCASAIQATAAATGWLRPARRRRTRASSPASAPRRRAVLGHAARLGCVRLSSRSRRVSRSRRPTRPTTSGCPRASPRMLGPRPRARAVRPVRGTTTTCVGVLELSTRTGGGRFTFDDVETAPCCSVGSPDRPRRRDRSTMRRSRRPPSSPASLHRARRRSTRHATRVVASASRALDRRRPPDRAERRPSIPRPAYARESVVLRLPSAVSLDDLTPEWAWGGSTGAGVRVAVIDSGIDADHPALGDCVAIVDNRVSVDRSTAPRSSASARTATPSGTAPRRRASSTRSPPRPGSRA